MACGVDAEGVAEHLLEHAADGSFADVSAVSVDGRLRNPRSGTCRDLGGILPSYSQVNVTARPRHNPVSPHCADLERNRSDARGFRVEKDYGSGANQAREGTTGFLDCEDQPIQLRPEGAQANLPGQRDNTTYSTYHLPNDYSRRQYQEPPGP